MKLTFKFGGLAGEIAMDVKVAETLPVVVVLEDVLVVVVVTLVFIAVVVLEEGDTDVVVVAAGDEDEQAETAMVKASANPITRQEPNNCIFLTFIVSCPLLDQYLFREC